MEFSYTFEEKEQIIKEFNELPVDSPEKADQFFEKHGKGNGIISPNYSVERLCAYRDLLIILLKTDRDKYIQIHKGIPFYFMAWLCFDIGNYDSALFFIDSAISEDKRKSPVTWISEPAAKFLTLEDINYQVAQRNIILIKNNLSTRLDLFSNVSNLPKITVEDFITKFVKSLIKQDEKRVVVSAFYSYFLKSGLLRLDLELQQNFSGSSAQYLNHLFSGSVLFETLLKIKYPAYKNEPLGEIFKDKGFVSKFGKFQFPDTIIDFSMVLAGNTLLNYEMQTCFETLYKIRNTTGHNLIWDDSLIKENYFELEIRIFCAIMYFIQKEFCE